jgi:hypothetical protein
MRRTTTVDGTLEVAGRLEDEELLRKHSIGE